MIIRGVEKKKGKLKGIKVRLVRSVSVQCWYWCAERKINSAANDKKKKKESPMSLFLLKDVRERDQEIVVFWASSHFSSYLLTLPNHSLPYSNLLLYWLCARTIEPTNDNLFRFWWSHVAYKAPRCFPRKSSFVASFALSLRVGLSRCIMGCWQQ